MVLKRIIDSIINADGSISVDDPGVISAFTSNPEFPFLVSFSRTGSHWLRMIMELYFEKPSLVRAFYFKDTGDFTCYHTHDMDLKLERKNVIYLYRNPVETVYSQLRYYEEDINDASRRKRWVELYARHLAKWLVYENFTTKKTVLTYEDMRARMHDEFFKICAHFGQSLNEVKLNNVINKVSKDELKRKTAHDKQVVNLSDEYRESRSRFENEYSDEIFGYIFSFEPDLEPFLLNSMDRD